MARSDEGHVLRQVATVLLSGMFVYDVWWVFIQPLVTSSESVMIAVRRALGFEGLALPIHCMMRTLCLTCPPLPGAALAVARRPSPSGRACAGCGWRPAAKP